MLNRSSNCQLSRSLDICRNIHLIVKKWYFANNSNPKENSNKQKKMLIRKLLTEKGRMYFFIRLAVFM